MAAGLYAPWGAEMVSEWTGPVTSCPIPVPLNSLGQICWRIRNAVIIIIIINLYTVSV